MNSNKCVQCGLVNFATTTECKRCHASFSSDGASVDVNSGGSESSSFQNQGNSFGRDVAHSNGYQAKPAGMYYQQSGEVTATGMVMGLLGGLAAGLVLAFVYSYVIYYIPFVYITFFCTVGYAIAIGASVGGIMKWGKVRNTGICVFVAMVATLVSYFVSWAVWLAVVASSDKFSISSLTLIQHPIGMWELLLKVNEVGAWSMFGTTVSGGALWIIWFIEAFMVLIGSPLIAWSTLTSDVFCESCEMWCEEDKSVATIGVVESAELKRRVEAKDFEYFKSVGAKTEDAEMWYRLDLHTCPNCNNTNALSVKLESLKADSKGKPTVQTTEFIEKLLLSATEFSQLRTIGSELRQTRQAA